MHNASQDSAGVVKPQDQASAVPIVVGSPVPPARISGATSVCGTITVMIGFALFIAVAIVGEISDVFYVEEYPILGTMIQAPDWKVQVSFTRMIYMNQTNGATQNVPRSDWTNVPGLKNMAGTYGLSYILIIANISVSGLLIVFQILRLCKVVGPRTLWRLLMVLLSLGMLALAAITHLTTVQATNDNTKEFLDFLLTGSSALSMVRKYTSAFVLFYLASYGIWGLMLGAAIRTCCGHRCHNCCCGCCGCAMVDDDMSVYDYQQQQQQPYTATPVQQA